MLVGSYVFDRKLNKMASGALCLVARLLSTSILPCLQLARPAIAQGRSGEPQHFESALPDGALWATDIPQNWNGTLLVESHGYATAVRPPETAPIGTKDWLLRHGYALVASSYSKPGWAIAEALPDQISTIDVRASLPAGSAEGRLRSRFVEGLRFMVYGSPGLAHKVALHANVRLLLTL